MRVKCSDTPDGASSIISGSSVGLPGGTRNPMRARQPFILRSYYLFVVLILASRDPVTCVCVCRERAALFIKILALGNLQDFVGSQNQADRRLLNTLWTGRDLATQLARRRWGVLVLRDDALESCDVFQQALAGQHQEVVTELRILEIDFQELLVGDREHVAVFETGHGRRALVVGREEAEFAHQPSRRQL